MYYLKQIISKNGIISILYKMVVIKYHSYSMCSSEYALLVLGYG